MDHVAWLKETAKLAADKAEAELVEYVKKNVEIGSIYTKKGFSRRTILNISDEGEITCLRTNFKLEVLPPRYFLTLFDGFEPTEKITADFLSQVKLVCGV